MKRPARSYALSYLSRLLLSLGPGAQLPPVHRLADGAGVSPVTMRRAVSTMVGDGRIVQKGRRFFTGTPAATTSDGFPPPRTIRDRITERMRWDIVAAVFPAGERLPSLSTLASRYGCGRRRMMSVLRRLHDEGLVSPHGRGYAPASPAADEGRNTVVVIDRSALIGDRIAHGELGRRRYRHGVEAECARRNLVVREVPYGYRGEDLVPMVPFDFTSARQQGVLGFVVLTPGFYPDQLREACRLPAATGLPVAVIDGNGAGLVAFQRMPRRFLLFPMWRGPDPAREVAQQLFGLGHRHIAYLSADHGQRWSQRRLDGLRQVFERPGAAGTVTALVSAVQNTVTHTPGIRGWLDRTIGSLPVPDMPGAPAVAPSVQAALGSLSSSVLLSMITDTMLRRDAENLAGKLDSLPTVTAVVGANDEHALTALVHLRARGVDIPGRISVVGFDDTKEAYGNNLASYSHNNHIVHQRAVDYILSPSAFRKVARQGRVRIRGTLRARGSLGRGPGVR